MPEELPIIDRVCVKCGRHYKGNRRTRVCKPCQQIALVEGRKRTHDSHRPPLPMKQYQRMAERVCLGRCGKMFLSEGPWNRICPKCTANEDRHKIMPRPAYSPKRVLLGREWQEENE